MTLITTLKKESGFRLGKHYRASIEKINEDSNKWRIKVRAEGKTRQATVRLVSILAAEEFADLFVHQKIKEIIAEDERESKLNNAKKQGAISSFAY